MSNSNKKEIKKDILGGINLGENNLLSILGACFNEIQKIVESENMEEKEKEKTDSLRKDRGFGLSFVDSEIPEGIEINDNTKFNKSFDVDKKSKYIADVISDFILETAINPKKPIITTAHASQNRIGEILANLKESSKEDDNFEESTFDIRTLTPKNLEVLMITYSIEEIASKYGVSVDEIEFLCKLWDVHIDKKDIQIYVVDDLNLFNIAKGYLSIIESMNEENKIELTKHFIESFNYSLSLLNPKINIEGRILLPIIYKQFNTIGNISPSLILVGLKSNLLDVIKEIETSGYFNYMDKLLK